MYVVPLELRHGPFTRADALGAGITPRVLEGSQFVRLHHQVYRHRSHPQCFEDDLRAARLALPDGARTTGITRIQELGLDTGPRAPLHFVLEGDHHLTLSGVFLHRTVVMPPEDGVGVSAEAAFVAYCAEARTIDAIRVGGALLHRDLMDAAELATLVLDQPWRRGCAEADWVLPQLDGRCRSLPEAELLALVRFAGLPEPAVNAPILLEDGHEVTPDLWFEDRRCAVEYEGGQHQEGPRPVHRRHRSLRGIPTRGHRLRAGHQGADAQPALDRPAHPPAARRGRVRRAGPVVRGALGDPVPAPHGRRTPTLSPPRCLSHVLTSRECGWRTAHPRVPVRAPTSGA